VIQLRIPTSRSSERTPIGWAQCTAMRQLRPHRSALTICSKSLLLRRPRHDKRYWPSQHFSVTRDYIGARENGER
jgi:hypothetical protein